MINIAGVAVNNINDSGYVDNNEYIFVSSCGYQKFITKDLTVLREKGLLDYQIIYVVKGKLHCWIKGRKTEVNEGSFILFRPKERQHYSYLAKDSTEVYWIHFTGYGIAEHLKKLGLPDDTIFQTGHNSRCIELFQLIINEIQVKKPAFVQLAAAYLSEIAAILARQYYSIKEQRNGIADDDIKRIIEAMHIQYSKNHPISYYASKCNLSVFRFIHKFKSSTGMSPLEYLTKIRINTAKELLSSSSLNISDVSHIIGYENPLYFSRIFKKETGLSPSCYKRQTVS